MKKFLSLLVLLATLAGPTSAQAPQSFDEWLYRNTVAAEMFVQISLPSQDAMYWYFLGRLSALEDVRDRLP